MPPVKAAKRIGKENAPPKASKSKLESDAEQDFDDSFGDESIELEAPPVKTKSTKTKSASHPALEESSTGTAELERKLKAMTAERDRFRAQREAFAKQFEELSKMRSTSVESLFEKYKEKAAVQSKAQNEIILNLTELNEKLQARAITLEKGIEEANAARIAALEPSAKPDPKEIKALKDELVKARSALKEKEGRLSNVEKEYKFEMEQHRKLQSSSRTPAPAADTTSKEEVDKDQASLSLYEDITDLRIVNVKIVQGKNGKEKTFNCIQTVGENNLNFTLKSFNEISPELLASRPDNPWVKSLLFTPKGLEYEKKDFVEQIGVFKQQFAAPSDQVSTLWDNLREALVAKA